jgi:hypothetical protein
VVRITDDLLCFSKQTGSDLTIAFEKMEFEWLAALDTSIDSELVEFYIKTPCSVLM